MFILDKEKYAKDLIEKTIHNKCKNVRFSYDIMGYPNEIIILVYLDNVEYLRNQYLFRIRYVVYNHNMYILN